MEQYFRVRAHRPEYRTAGDTWPKMLPGEYLEPVEAVDAAEAWLRVNGKDGQSFCDILFNGDTDPHSSLFRISVDRYGIWNREGVPWPVDYIDAQTGEPWKILDHPHFIAEGEDDIPPAPEPADEREKGEDARRMKIDSEDEEEEEGFDEDEEADAESDGDSEDFPDDQEDEEDAEDDPEGNESDPDSDSEDSEEDEDAEDERAGGDEDSEDEIDEDEDGDDEDESEDESESESEPEMPRLTIFAKMRGPKGWRKRAEAEELNERNVFGLKIGVVDPDGETAGQQEKNVRCEIQFIEDESERKHGTLRIKADDGNIVFSKQGKWLVAEIPYYDES